MKVFEFYDGETHWLGAKTREDAEEYFRKHLAGDIDEPSYEYEVKECSDEYREKPFINNSETPEDHPKYGNLKKINLNEALDMCIADGCQYPYILAASVWG